MKTKYIINVSEVDDIDELTELLDAPIEDIAETPKRGKTTVVLVGISLFGILLYCLIYGVDIRLGDLLNIAPNDSLDNGVIDTHSVDNIETLERSKAIDAKLQNGALLGDVVKDYFKIEYGIDVTLVDTVELGLEDKATSNIRLITVREVESGGTYELKYVHGVNGTILSDTYGATLTSKLLGVKLTDYYKSVLPEGSFIWVDSTSLGEHTSVKNIDIADIILNSSIDKLLSYTDEVDLFKSIGVNIVMESDTELDYTYTVEECVDMYESFLLDISSRFKNSKSGTLPKIEVSYLRGEKGKLDVMSYLEKKVGMTALNSNFFINWYDEIPLMGEEAKDSIIGAMSLRVDANALLIDYYTKGVKQYKDKSSDSYINVYSGVDKIIEESIVKEQKVIESGVGKIADKRGK